MIQIFESTQYPDFRLMKLIGSVELQDATLDDQYHQKLENENRRVISIVDCSEMDTIEMAFVKYFAHSTKQFERQFIEGHVFGLNGVKKMFYKAFKSFLPSPSFPIYLSESAQDLNERFKFDLYQDFDVLIESNITEKTSTF